MPEPGQHLPAAAARTVAVASAAATTAAASPPPAVSPLVQAREWRRAAQRRVRLALTGVRAAWSAFHAASERGHGALAALSDVLLLMVQLRAMPLGALKDVEGLKAAACRKLLRRYHDLWGQLDAACSDMEQCAQAALGHCADVSDAVTTAEPETPSPMQVQPHAPANQLRPTQPAAPNQQAQFLPSSQTPAAPAPTALQPPAFMSQPVFATLPAPRVAELLHEVADMLHREARLRRGVCRVLASPPPPMSSGVAALSLGPKEEGYREETSVGGHNVDGPQEHRVAVEDAGSRRVGELVSAALESVGGGSSNGVGPRTSPVTVAVEPELRGMLTVHLCAWLSAPYLDDGRATEVMEGVALDMAGF